MTKRKIDYQRWTFILSVIGFIGSIGFYLGVLRQVYSPDLDALKIEQLEFENEDLRKEVEQLREQMYSHE